jgi:CRISPR-associated protein Cas1
MKRHLNTLYVTTDGAYVRKDGANIVVEANGAERARVPVHMLGGLVCFGRISLSVSVMGFCSEEGVTITYLSQNGRFLARVEGPIGGNVLLRHKQHLCSEHSPDAVAIVRGIVAAKTANQRAILQRALRDHGASLADEDRVALGVAADRLLDITRRTLKPIDIDGLRGLEGEAGHVYFDVFGKMLRTNEDSIYFNGRSRRPPLDPVNSVLSLVYTLLVHDCRSALESVGLDPCVGFLHRLRPGRPSLALDLMEELRPHLADRLALTLFNRGELKARDFRVMENGAVLLEDVARKNVLIAYQDRKKDEIDHDFLQEKTSIGLLPHLQAQLLARTLRGDLDAYPALIWK